MANFSTHLLGAAGAGVLATSLLAATDLLPLAGVASGVGMVALGGISPDVDSDYSDSIELVFGLLGVALGVPVMIALLPQLGLLAAMGVLVAAYVVVRYGVILVFRRLTVHRGVFHSIPMALFLGCVVALVAHAGMGNDPVVSWVFAGLFVVGFVTHLVLDETYSVDLANRHIKRSFGTALKLFDREHAWLFVVLYAAIVVAILLAPSPGPLFNALGDLEIRMFPAPRALANLWP